MAVTHNLGFPRIGAGRELKFALESYWKGISCENDLQAQAQKCRLQNWQVQSGLDWVPVADFSLYDHVLDMSFTLGNIPERFQNFKGSKLDNYFRVARGQSVATQEQLSTCCMPTAAGEMTKWFDTNYHYIVPEFTAKTTFQLDTARIIEQIKEARELNFNIKPVIIGPVTYLALGKVKDGSNCFILLNKLIHAYLHLLNELAAQGIEWVQIDEPLLVTELDRNWQHAFNTAYHTLKSSSIKIMLTTYFGGLGDNQYLVANLPVAGVHIDAVAGRAEVQSFLNIFSSHKVISLGVINGRNIWKDHLTDILDWLEPIAQKWGSNLWIAPSCSLLHIPVDLDNELELDPEVKSWLAFAVQKIADLKTLAKALNHGRNSVKNELDENFKALQKRATSELVHDSGVKKELANITANYKNRKNPFEHRSKVQEAFLRLPIFPTTTIGSFPQTVDIRRARSQFKKGLMDASTYKATMQAEIERCIKEQEKLGLDILVHGEAERNDMVEYFGEQMQGYAISQFGWVQSYGSRCVKPPILYGDISRKNTMTLAWITHAQSLTNKPVKGMLTGPVTMLNWSFVRDDQPRAETAKQLALAIRQEVLELEAAGVKVIQIDEAALREGLPLRKSEWDNYLNWAIDAFRIAANGVDDKTQIHTHMCYSEFNDIIQSIARMDADVITIETSRSDMELLDAFNEFKYPNEIGPGVYDIHSPNIPAKQQIVDLMLKAAERIPTKRLWVNPDCGLKTRQWSEVIPALRAMVDAAHQLRGIHSK